MKLTEAAKWLVRRRQLRITKGEIGIWIEDGPGHVTFVYRKVRGTQGDP